jgi:hypothetical protein
LPVSGGIVPPAAGSVGTAAAFTGLRRPDQGEQGEPLVFHLPQAFPQLGGVQRIEEFGRVHIPHARGVGDAGK